jgi:hypothetical protein
MSSTTASSSSSSNDLLCRLKQSLDTIFDDRKQTSEKISKLFDIATMQPGACGSSEVTIPEATDSDVRPLVEMYVFTNESEYFANVVSETREDKLRTDIFYTVTTPLYIVKAYNDIFNKDIQNVVAGQSVVDTWGSNLLWDNTKKTWPGKFTAVLKRDQLKQIVGSYDEESDRWTQPAEVKGAATTPFFAQAPIPVVTQTTSAALTAPNVPKPDPPTGINPAGEDKNDLLEDHLILGIFDSINLFDYKYNKYVSVLTSQIKKGSDDLYYLLQSIPKDTRDINKVSYKLSVFKTRAIAQRARDAGEKKAAKK